MGFILNIIASIILWFVRPIIYLISCIISGLKGEFDKYNKSLALSKDQYGNVLGQYIFNIIFIKKEGYKFGNIDETISSVIGKNKVKDTLTLLGVLLDNLFEIFDKNHSIDSIDNTEDNG